MMVTVVVEVVSSTVEHASGVRARKDSRRSVSRALRTAAASPGLLPRRKPPQLPPRARVQRAARSTPAGARPLLACREITRGAGTGALATTTEGRAGQRTAPRTHAHVAGRHARCWVFWRDCFSSWNLAMSLNMATA